MNIGWIFFDLGSTLIDETECERVRILNTVGGSDVTPEEFDALYRELCSGNLDGYNRAREHFGLAKGAWPTELERLYPGVPELLSSLSKQFSLGIIANQKSGLFDRLDELGIGKYFQVLAGSGDLGIAKPEPEIFLKALELVGCVPSEAVMVGDRLDNDIIPAQALGMHTVWVRQGYGALGDASILEMKPDMVIDGITELDISLIGE